MDSRTYFPHDVLSLWEEAIGTFPGQLAQVVLDYAPPVSNWALEVVQSWNMDPGLERTLEELRDRGIPEGRPRALFTRYPLFAAHLRIAEHPNSCRGAHELLIQTIGGDRVPHDSADIQPDTYYQDCLVTRKAIWRLLDQPAAGQHDESLRARLLIWLETSPEESGFTPTDQSRCLRLVRGERLPGTPSHTRVTHHDSSHLKRVPRAITTTTARHKFPALPADNLVPEYLDDQPIRDYHHTSSSKNLSADLADSAPRSPKEPSDPDKPDQYRRRHADFRTRGDDRHALGQLPWLQSVRNTRSPADIHRLPFEHVSEAVRGLHQREKFTEWAFAWMLSATSIPVHRLAKLAVHDNMSASVAIGSTPRIILEESRLEIPLLDGPSGPPGSDSRVVRLPLPSAIIDVLKRLGPGQPFLQAPGYVDHTLRRHFQRFPGLTPTCQRIRATAEAVIQGLAPDSVTGLTLKGEYGHSSRGAAAYRQTATQELVDLFRRACAYWRDKVPIADPSSLDAFPVPATTSESQLDGYIGSLKVATFEQFRAVFQHLQDEIARLVARTHREKGSSGVELGTLLNLQQAHAQLTYLAFLLSTGIRPISTRATMRLAGNYWYVQDKDSPGFSERRAVPALPEIVNQVLEQRDFTRMLCDTVPLRRLRRSGSSNEESDIPLWLEASGRTLKLSRMKQSDIDAVFERFGLASRATRHTFANVLRSSVSETELHALLGHSGGGWQRESVLSMGEARYTQSTWQAIQTMLEDAGFHPVNPAGTHAS